MTYRTYGLVGWLVAMGFAACAQRAPSFNDDDDGGPVIVDDDGSGGAGGTTTVGPTTTQANSSTTVGPGPGPTTGPSTATSTATGPMGCDSGLGMDINSIECSNCIQCTQTSDCATEWNACSINTPCDSFITCLSNCDFNCGNNTACFDSCMGLDNETSTCVSPTGCIGQSPTGCMDYLTALSCSVCQFCPGDCDAVNNCS